MATDVIIFDVEGTLVDCVPDVLESWHVTLAKSGHSVRRSDLQHLSGMDGSDMLDHLLPHVEQSEKATLLKLQGERYRRDYLPLAKPFQGVSDLLRRLKDRDCILGIATTCKADELKAYDTKLGMLPLIEAVACGDDAPKGKPHPDLFYQVLKKLGIADARRALAVGDSAYDARAAKPLGSRAVGVTTGGFSAKELMAAGCDAVLAHVTELEDYLARVRG